MLVYKCISKKKIDKNLIKFYYINYYIMYIYIQSTKIQIPESLIHGFTTNNVKALFELAVRYEDGIDVVQDHTKAVKIYNKILEQSSDSDAAYNLALLYEKGLGVEQDFSMAYKLYDQGVKNGDSDSMLNQALLYKNGLGIKQDFNKCFNLLCTAAGYQKLDKHHDRFKKIGNRVLCEGKVGKITHTQYSDNCWNYVKISYDDGTTNKIHYTKGFLRYTSLPGSKSQTEDVWVKTDVECNRNAMYHLARLYHFGDGVQENIDTAIYFYKIAATTAHKNSTWPGDPQPGCPRAQFNLGVIYRKGFKHIESDPMEALKWYNMSADQNYEKAQCAIGVIYDKGVGVRQSYNKAFRWYMKAAEQGHVNAQYNVGCMYDHGEGVKQSDSNALIWYQKAAEQGNSDAFVNLGIMYQNGQGVPRDYEKAINYYLDALEKGDSDSRNCIINLWNSVHSLQEDLNVNETSNSSDKNISNSININDNYFSKN